MFSKPEVIDASKNYVCVRIETYESEENQEIVRSHLNGRLENTVFCLLSPDGETRLTRSGRGPMQVFGSNTENIVARMNEIAAKYKRKGDDRNALVPDFNSFKLALNTASADQRVLVLIAASEDKLPGVGRRMGRVASKSEVRGRFHFDSDSSGEWLELLSMDSDSKEGIFLVAPGAYGLKGKVLRQLQLDATHKEILAALQNANASYSQSTEKKEYSSHVQKGREEGITIEMAMPYGEDRDADGEIDRRGRGSGRRSQRGER